MNNTNQETLSKLMMSEQFSIPEYQRGYAWSERQVTDLLEDLEHIWENQSKTHYFGTIVTTDPDRGNPSDIIDGQQRITTITLLFSRINAELVRLNNEQLSESTKIQQKIEQTQRFVWETSQKKNTVVDIDDVKKDVYHALIQGERINEKDIENPSQRRLIDATTRIEDWLAEIEAQYTGPEQEKQYVEDLMTVGGLLADNFEITRYRVGDELEAGRMFGVLNDRGKDLNIADKVKSHLVYVASQLGDTEMVADVHECFVNVFEQVLGADGDDADIDVFMDAHWMIFTGSLPGDRDRTIPRLLKNDPRYAAFERDAEILTEWITRYLESLREFARSYHRVTNPLSEIPSDGASLTHIRKHLYIINRFAGKNYYLPFVMTVDVMIPDQESQRDLYAKLERYVLRSAVERFQTNYVRRYLRQDAFRVYWAGRQDQYTELFGTSPNTIYESKRDGKKEMLGSIRVDKDSEKFYRCLTENDVLSAVGVNGWSGVRLKAVIDYILFEYENSLRDTVEQYSIDEFESWKNSKAREHIHPKSEPDSVRASDGRTYVDAVGNIVMLSPDLNSKAADRPFREKVTTAYHESELEQVAEICDRTTREWEVEQITDRSERIAEFAESRW